MTKRSTVEAMMGRRARKGLIGALVGGAIVTAALGSVAAARPSATRAQTSIDNAYALAVGRDGKVVLAGVSGDRNEHYRMALARYTARGRLDRSFGVGGKALTSFGSGNNSEARAVAVQGDGKIVLAGSLRPNGGVGFALARYTTRGRLDPSFGQRGKVVTRFGGRSSGAAAGGLAIQPDGKIVALGSWYRSPITGPTFIALVRYTPRGRLDPEFGHGGKLVTSFGPRGDSEPAVLLTRADGKLVVAGEYSGPVDSFVALARYNADGTLDRSFGGRGRVVSKLGDYVSGASAAVLQSGGKIVVNVNGDRSYLARYTADGKLDSSFGHGGKASASMSNRVLPLVARQRGDKLIVAGSVIGRNGRVFAVHRYEPDGGHDSSFGRGGRVFTDFGAPATANALAVQVNGKIVVAGSYRFNDFAVARYTSSGRLDAGFGSGGKVTTDFTSAWARR